MMVIVAGEVVEPIVGTQDARKLHQLLVYACDGRHVVIFDPPQSIDGWLEQVDAGSRSAYVDALGISSRKASALPADVSVVRILPVGQPAWLDPVASVRLDEALELLAEPLGVLVENSGNDWYFLLGLMRRPERELASRAVALGWVRVLHGGGSNVPAQIESRLGSAPVGLRTFVLFDSDRRHPEELDPAWSPTGQEACTGFQIETLTRRHMPQRYWMLRRRYIESYMPRSELQKGAGPNVHADAIEAFFRMSDDARWYYNMKRGFQQDDKVENRHRCRGLYDALSHEDRAVLLRGFGRIAESYAQAPERDFDWDAAARSEAAHALPNLLRLL